MTPDRELRDGDLWTLESGNPDAPKVQFILNQIDGRMGFRLMDKIGQGILVEEHQMTELMHILSAGLRAKSKWMDRSEGTCPSCGETCENCPLD